MVDDLPRCCGLLATSLVCDICNEYVKVRIAIVRED